MHDFLKTKGTIISIIFSMIVLTQIVAFLYEHKNMLLSILKNPGQSAVWRGANFFGQEFADFVAFIHQETPEDASILLPPNQGSFSPLSSTQYMQYFLYPRRISNCTATYDSCILQANGSENTYFLISDLEIIETIEARPSGALLMFNDRYAVLAPANAYDTHDIPLPTYSSLGYVVLDFLRGGFFLSLLWISGILILFSLLPDLDPIAVIGYGFGLGSGVFSLLITMPLLLNHALTRQIVILIIALFSVFAYIFSARHRKKPISVFAFNFFSNFARNKGLLLIIAFGGLITIIAVELGYHRDDALGIWAPKGYGIALEGFPNGPTNWGTLTTAYSLNIPLLIAGMRSVFSEILPESKLIFPFYSISLIFVCYAYLRKRADSSVATMAALVLGTTPIIFQHHLIAYANMAAAYYLISGVVLLESSLNSPQPSLNYQLSGSIFLSFAAWTRSEILVISLLILVLYLFVFPIRRITARQLVFIFGPILSYAVFWNIVKREAYLDAGFTKNILGDTISAILSSELHLEVLATTIRFFLGELFSLSVWGVMGFFILAGFLLRFTRRNTKIQLASFDSLAAICFLGIILAGYYATSFLKSVNHPVEWWLRSGLARMSMPGVILLWLASIGGILELLNERKDNTRIISKST